MSNDSHWSIDKLSIIDPKQMRHIIDSIDIFQDYGLQYEIFESAFFKFKIDKKVGKNLIRLVQAQDSLLESEEMLFALPKIVDEESGPYIDFLNHITKLRVKFLNDVIENESKFTIEEIEEEIRENLADHYIEGKVIRAFDEISDILEYVPSGYEIDEENEDDPSDESIEDEFPDIDEEDENIEEDETMRWDDEEEEFDEDDDDEEDESDEEDDYEEIEPTPKRGRPRKN